MSSFNLSPLLRSIMDRCSALGAGASRRYQSLSSVDKNIVKVALAAFVSAGVAAIILSRGGGSLLTQRMWKGVLGGSLTLASGNILSLGIRYFRGGAGSGAIDRPEDGQDVEGAVGSEGGTQGSDTTGINGMLGGGETAATPGSGDRRVGDAAAGLAPTVTRAGVLKHASSDGKEDCACGHGPGSLQPAAGPAPKPEDSSGSGTPFMHAQAAPTASSLPDASPLARGTDARPASSSQTGTDVWGTPLPTSPRLFHAPLD